MTSRCFPANRLLPVYTVKDVVSVVTEEAREQLLEASTVTKKAYCSYRREADPEEHATPADSPTGVADKSQDDGEMSVIITIMQPILRLMQLLCENHNRDLQVSQAGGKSSLICQSAKLSGALISFLLSRHFLLSPTPLELPALPEQ